MEISEIIFHPSTYTVTYSKQLTSKAEVPSPAHISSPQGGTIYFCCGFHTQIRSLANSLKQAPYNWGRNIDNTLRLSQSEKLTTFTDTGHEFIRTQ